MIFGNKVWLLGSPFDMVKLLLLSWIKFKDKGFSYDYYISMKHSTTQMLGVPSKKKKTQMLGVTFFFPINFILFLVCSHHSFGVF